MFSHQLKRLESLFAVRDCSPMKLNNYVCDISAVPQWVAAAEARTWQELHRGIMFIANVHILLFRCLLLLSFVRSIFFISKSIGCHFKYCCIEHIQHSSSDAWENYDRYQ